MANRSNTYLWTTLRPCFTSLYLAFLLHNFTNTVSGVSPAPYIPVDNIILNCGSSRNSTAIDGRTWIGDDNSKFFPPSLSQNQASLAANPVQKSPLASQIPYTTARLSVSAFTYIFPVTTGQKFIRLYFYPASYSNFDRSRALFSVKAGPFTLLNNFNASLTADADADPRDTIFREFCVNVKEDERLNLTFTPSDSNSFAFINGIEILSMPSNLYYTPPDNEGLPFIGQLYPYLIDNRTALQELYRINVGGRSISPNEDTGMFRSWESDLEYMIPRKSALPQNMSIELIFTKISPYTAPEDVYRTARTMGDNKAFNKNHNLTWEFSVDSQSDYLVRLHFCEFQPEMVDWHERVFLIFIANQIAEKEADVMIWSGRRKGVPVYKDYAVSMRGEENQKKMNLSITLQANPNDYVSDFNDAILNGIEIFKVSDPSGNLAGPNLDPLSLAPPKSAPSIQSTELKKNNKTTIIAVGGGVSGFTILLILVVLIFRLTERVKNSDNSTKASGSTLPCNLSRYFSLTEIIAATNNFDKVFIIGAEGFSDVYKGYINGSAATLVVIK